MTLFAGVVILTREINPDNHYTVSIHYDRRLYEQDIKGSMAHARMLARQGIITQKECKAIVEGLQAVFEEIEEGCFPWRPELEDLHMNIESRLYDKIGRAAGKLHTGRSRNDQISVDLRMYVKGALTTVDSYIREFQRVLVTVAEANLGVVIPGYTHLQKAQPVLFSHHILAYYEMLSRDRERFSEAYKRTDVLTLGSGALAGVTYPIDREYVATQLGFGSTSSNSIDAVSDRDFLLDYHCAAAICIVHLSRLAEELIIWSTEEFGMIRLAERYTTGSSMMPQKRNPDFAELARGKSGRVFGNLVGLLTVLKGLPMSYNRDMQEDKEGFFDTHDTLIETLRVFSGMISTLEVKTERMRQSSERGFTLATDVADYLVAKGLPFRESHGVVAMLSLRAEKERKTLKELSLEIYREYSELFEDDVFNITLESSISARDVPGGTAYVRVQDAITRAWSQLQD